MKVFLKLFLWMIRSRAVGEEGGFGRSGGGNLLLRYIVLERIYF